MVRCNLESLICHSIKIRRIRLTPAGKGLE
nr:MAG TPA_asm: hypothetical protein [Caudoviricetes sp.]